MKLAALLTLCWLGEFPASAASARPWLAPLRSLSDGAPQAAGSAALGAVLSIPQAPVRDAALSPLIEALRELPDSARLRRDMSRIAELPAARREEILATLDRARGEAAERAASGARSAAQAPAAEGLQGEIARLDALRRTLDWSVRLYGDGGGLAFEAASVAGRLRTLRRSAALAAFDREDIGVLPSDKESLKNFLETADEGLLASNPAMFRQKMAKAAASDFKFFRGFPNLFYLYLSRAPEAAALKATPELRLAGDIHGENIELVRLGRRLAPQVNDFDDSARAPAAVEVARAAVGAALLGDPPASSRPQLFNEALEGYRRSLGMEFSDWVASIAGEKAVTEAKAERKDWIRTAGTLVVDKALSARLFALAGLSPRQWTLFDRTGAGLSSIGVRRYMFASDARAHAQELKELRESALVSFTGKPSGASPRERVAQAYRELRQVPAEIRTMNGAAIDWLLRRRAGRQTLLSFDHPKSAARVIGGLAAQLHRAQLSDTGLLEAAARTVSARLAASSLQYMSRMRRLLKELLKDGAWGAS